MVSETKNGALKIKLATAISIIAILIVIVFGLSEVLSTKASKAQVKDIEKTLCKDIESNKKEIEKVEKRTIKALDKIGRVLEKIEIAQISQVKTLTKINTILESHTKF